MQPANSLRPVFSLLYAASFWGVVWYPLRLLADAGISGSWQMLIAYGAAAVVYLLVFRPCLSGLTRHPWTLLLLAMAAGWTNIAFVLAMLEGSVVRVLLLFYLSPLWAVLMGHFLLGERLGLLTLVTLPLGLAGSVLMIWQPGSGFSWPPDYADWMALSAGMAFALSNVLTRKLQGVNVPAKTVITWLGVVALAGIVIMAGHETVPQVSGIAWGGALVLGVMGFMLSTLSVIYGVTHLPVQRSAVILLSEILVGGLSAWWIAGEIMGLREWVGGLMILIAGFVAATRIKYE